MPLSGTATSTAHTVGDGPPGARVVARDGPHAYDVLEPELLRHAASRPDDPAYDARREHLIREFLPLVRNLARRFSAVHCADDVEQAGVIGLIRAIDRYDPASTTGGPLAYLVPTVRGEMLRHLRDNTWMVRVPRGLKDTAIRLNRASATLTQRLGRSPRPGELAEELGVPLHTVVEALGALDSYRPASLDVPDPETGRPAGERVGADDPGIDLIDGRGDLRRVVAALPQRERTIVLLSFFGGHTQTQIGDRLGISQMHVSRLLARALTRLRAGLTADDPAGAAARTGGHR